MLNLCSCPSRERQRLLVLGAVLSVLGAILSVLGAVLSVLGAVLSVLGVVLSVLGAVFLISDRHTSYAEQVLWYDTFIGYKCNY